ncbi:MAG TPA: hypothetical protein VJ302_30465 [Blastocatellia bacterium]|nr:hypothetical protein [Blastocatellia bacterium]
MSEQQNNQAPAGPPKKRFRIGWLGWTCLVSVIAFIGWMSFVASMRPFTEAEMTEETKKPVRVYQSLSENPPQKPPTENRPIRMVHRQIEDERWPRGLTGQSPAHHLPPSRQQTSPHVTPHIRPRMRHTPTPIPTPNLNYHTENRRNYGKEP